MTAGADAYNQDYKDGFRLGLRLSAAAVRITAEKISDLPAEADTLRAFADEFEAKIPTIIAEVIGGDA